MNDKRTKYTSTLNWVNWKSNAVIVLLLANLSTSAACVLRNNTILQNQQEIMQNQQMITNSIESLTQIAKTDVKIAPMITMYSDNISLVEDISADSGTNIKTEKVIISNEHTYIIPDIDTSFKSYMAYTAITNTSSAQYKLQHDDNTWTDDLGLRRHNNDYIVALGTYFSDHVGDRFLVNLENGNKFTIIVGDIKDNSDTDSTNKYHSVYNVDGSFKSANIIEFIIDKNRLNSTIKKMGDVGAIDFFSGNIESIERIKE